MIVFDFLKALSQIGDPRFLRVLGKGVGLTIGLLVAFYVLFLFILNQIGAAAWIAGLIGLPETWIGTGLGIGGLLLFMGLSIILMVPVASAITGLFLEEVADAVEAQHYPGLPPTTPLSLSDNITESLKFLGVIVGANILALIVFLVVPFLGPLPFWATNGYLLGREYFIMAAQRHIGTGSAKALFSKHMMRVWLGGTLMAIPLTIPLVNLLIPTLGAATFTHQFHRLRQAPSG